MRNEVGISTKVLCRKVVSSWKSTKHFSWLVFSSSITTRQAEAVEVFTTDGHGFHRSEKDGPINAVISEVPPPVVFISSCPAVTLMTRGFEVRITFRDKIPIDDVEPRGDVVGAPVLVLKVVRVLPD